MLEKLLKEHFTVCVPVKVSMTTGYTGGSSVDTIFVDLEDVDFDKKDVSPSICQIAYEMACENAQSYGEDTQDCGECDSCQNGDECDDPVESDSVEGCATLFIDEDDEGDIDNAKDKILLYSKEYGFWLAFENKVVTDRVNELLDTNNDLWRKSMKFTNLYGDLQQALNRNKPHSV